ncbi:uncharacterized protein LOC129717749 isoform X2 [Wyeomyia smithii]|uniref:uncharacterized protein LOC129717749 isoform X2 n=1 Tax=Wyeomyia smithii TaxID=174621 RepID=UPI0024680FA7|nr:uncharacterized protein LOC129717749 isoform X2 [Wyeomyia smithii]
MIRWILLMALLASPGLSQKAEKRRAFYRRTTTTTAAPVQKEIESTESKQTDKGGEGLYTVGDSFAIGASSGDNVGKGSSFKPITSNGDKLTSFSEYNFGGTKLSDSSDPDSDEDYGLAPRNHKPQLPISPTNSYKPSGSFDFFNNDYSKPSLDTKPKTSITSKFSISHPTPTKNTYTGRLDHLDDSSEYDLYSNLKIGHNYKSALQSYTGGKSSPFSTFSGSPLSFEAKVKKLPSSYDDYGLSTITTKNKKNKLSLDDDTFGGTGGSYGISNNFGVGLLGKPEKASASLYDIDSSESGFGSSKFKPYKGSSLTNSYHLDSSDESDETFVKQKFPKLHSSYGSIPQKPITEYESDFDVKNIKLPGAHNKFRPHTNTKSNPYKSKLHASDIDNPNPLEFRPNFKLQDVPNLYPDEHIGASIAAKGQIENFLNAEHGFKATTHFLDGHPGKKPTYQQFLKSQEDEKLEKEALKAQIEYLKAHASKRPSEIRQRPPGPPGPPFPQHPVGPQHAHGGRGRPVRRIPGAHLPLGVKAPHPAPRIPHFNDRPYSISFKL